MYLLDTNICIAILNGTSTGVVQRLKQTPRSNVYLCPIVKAELYYGAHKSTRRGQNLALLERFFSEFEILLFNDRGAEIYGSIRAVLAKKGTPIGPNDLIIAATALAYDAVLITHNIREFSRVPDLKIEDWEI